MIAWSGMPKGSRREELRNWLSSGYLPGEQVRAEGRQVAHELEVLLQQRGSGLGLPALELAADGLAEVLRRGGPGRDRQVVHDALLQQLFCLLVCCEVCRVVDADQSRSLVVRDDDFAASQVVGVGEELELRDELLALQVDHARGDAEVEPALFDGRVFLFHGDPARDDVHHVVVVLHEALLWVSEGYRTCARSPRVRSRRSATGALS